MAKRWSMRAWALALVAAMAVATPGAAHAQGAGAQWTTPGGDLQNTRFSTLAEITPANVGSLVEEFSVPTGLHGSHQGQPLVVGSTLYMVTPFPHTLFAIDLAQGGKIKWTFSPYVDSFARGEACCDAVNRGAAYADGKIVFALLDDSVVAVDAVSGQQVWRTSLGNPYSGMTMSGAPLIVRDKVIVGNSGGELGVRGWILALDLATGKEVWRAYSTGPDKDVLIGPGFKPYYAKDRGADLGVTSWPTDMWQQGGGTVWAWITYDPALNLIFHGTSNPGVWNPDMRPGDNKWAASVFARNPDTGVAAWAYQLTPHDNWDFDANNEFIVVDAPPGKGVPGRKALAHFDKNGFAYLMDRATGQVLSAKPFMSPNWAKSINLATGLPVLDASKAVHQGAWTDNVCPSPFGFKDFEPAAFSPRTGLFYIPAINLCNNMQALQAIYVAGTPFLGSAITVLPGPGGNLGELVAWNALQGTRAWSVKEPLPLYGGALATAGGVVFYGTLDRWFKAVDARTGAPLYQKKLDCGVGSNPISFAGPDGRQRIAFYTGIGWLAGGLAGTDCPQGQWDDNHAGPPPGQVVDPTAGDSGALHVLKLP